MLRNWLVLFLAAGLLPLAPARAEEKQAEAPVRCKPALVVIDVQKEFLPYMSESDLKVAPLTINGAIWLFRERGFPVIRVYHTDPRWGPSPDSPGFQFLESIQVRPEDPQVVKNFPSSFKKTELESLLRNQGCNTLFLCGLSATGCVLATYHGAVDRDFDTFLVKGGLISPDRAQTEVIEDISETVTFEAMRVMLDEAKR